MWQFLNLIIYKRNIRSIHGYIRSNAAHSNTYVCFLQRRSIVNAVSNHADLITNLLHPANCRQLIFWKAICCDITDAKLP